MATAPNKSDPKPTDPKPEAGPKLIRAVYGRMVDPLTGMEYTGVPSELLKDSSWITSQLEAKKLELCDAPEPNPED